MLLSVLHKLLMISRLTSFNGHLTFVFLAEKLFSLCRQCLNINLINCFEIQMCLFTLCVFILIALCMCFKESVTISIYKCLWFEGKIKVGHCSLDSHVSFPE